MRNIQPETATVLQSAVKTVQTDASELATLITRFGTSRAGNFHAPEDKAAWGRIGKLASDHAASCQALTIQPAPEAVPVADRELSPVL